MSPRLPARLLLRQGDRHLAVVRVADNPYRRFRGLMGVRALPAGTGLLLSPCNSVHSWFMRFAIDVVFLDAGWRVVRVLPALRPWRFGPLVRGARHAVELPAGTAAQAGIALGDILAWDALPAMR